jgi:hypothetical protein
MNNFESKRKAICLICRNADVAWLDFLSAFGHYDIFVIADDNTTNHQFLKIKYPAINIVQIDPAACERVAFVNTNALHFNKVTGWDKALFYFIFKNTIYDHIWFLEDDVFFYNEQSLKNIDIVFPESDLLSAPYKTSTKTSRNWWWWPMIKVNFEAPYYNAMVCGVRVSRNLLDQIKQYASANKTLFFVEVLFPTIAIKKGLLYHTPGKMAQIYYRYNWTIFSKSNIFHPVKDLSLHQKAREDLNRARFLYKARFLLGDFLTRSIAKTKELIKSFLPLAWLSKSGIDNT